ncbi:MAG: c-type cytochrome [Verrucomicrobiaceae bacterium]|nr:c-type cytochrome [Verrucomicrobiaceae bacterium]
MNTMLKHTISSVTLAAALSAGIHTVRAADVTDSFLVMFKPLPAEAVVPDNELTQARTDLGRMLYFDKRMSKNQQISCNSCHVLDKYGTDNAAFSTGHKGQKGGRSAPTVFNAALHIAQFWDGRAPSVEEQAKGPVLNPIEMAMPDKEHVIKVIKSIPGYAELFAKAFPDDKDPVTYDNFGKAVGAFERKLLTPSRWDEFLKGKKDALTDAEKKGFETFASVGCVTCHNGAAVGGHMYQKLGLAKPWPGLKDNGRFEATKLEQDRFFFKVPSLRNITETGPYLHDGSVAKLGDMVKKMAEHQLGKEITNEQCGQIVTFLKALKGDLPADYIKEPKLPESGPKTPKPDPS